MFSSLLHAVGQMFKTSVTARQIAPRARLQVEAMERRDLPSAAPMNAMFSAVQHVPVVHAPVHVAPINGMVALQHLRAPAAPSVSAMTLSTSQIKLSWDTVPGATGYRIDEFVNGHWKQIAALGAHAESYTAPHLKASTLYDFEVKAINRVGASTSPELSIMTESPAPPKAASTGSGANTGSASNGAGATGGSVTSSQGGTGNLIAELGEYEKLKQTIQVINGINDNPIVSEAPFGLGGFYPGPYGATNYLGYSNY